MLVKVFAQAIASSSRRSSVMFSYGRIKFYNIERDEGVVRFLVDRFEPFNQR